MLPTLSLPSTLLIPLPRPCLPWRHLTMSWASSLKGGLLFTFPPVFSSKILPLALLFHPSLVLTSSFPFLPQSYTMSKQCHLCPRPRYLRPLLTQSHSLRIHLPIASTLTLPKNPSPSCPLIPCSDQPCHQIHNAHQRSHPMYQKLHIPTYALDGVRESLQQR